MKSLPAFRTALVVGAILLGGLLPVGANEPVQIITPQEAALPPVEPDGINRNITRGPGIDGVSPSPVGVQGSFRFAVKFKPRNGVEIEPETVRVTYLRAPLVDLTERLKEFITPQGIDAPDVVAPPGEHVLLIEAVDKEGRTGRGQVTLTVSAPQ